jgi:non-ribosomal peptide synthetase component E (peptide arylation enzyme)
VNIATNLDQAAFHFPDRPAVIEGDGSASFSEFNRDFDQIASVTAETPVTEAILDLGIDWSEVETLRDLQTGLRVAMAKMNIGRIS